MLNRKIFCKTGPRCTAWECGLLLPLYNSVVYVSVLVTSLSCADAAEPMEMPFVLWNRVGPRNHILRGGPDFPHAQTCLRSIFSVFFTRGQQLCGLWLSVYCSNLLWYTIRVVACIWPGWCHCHSLSLASVKSRLVLPFWYWLTRVVLVKGLLKQVCVVCVCCCIQVRVNGLQLLYDRQRGLIEH